MEVISEQRMRSFIAVEGDGAEGANDRTFTVQTCRSIATLHPVGRTRVKRNSTSSSGDRRSFVKGARGPVLTGPLSA